MKTSEKIIKYITKRKQVSAKELIDYLGLSRVAVSKQLDNLLTEGKLAKIGGPPRVFYLLREKEILEQNVKLDRKIEKFIDENYLIITPLGERKSGLGGFAYWCRHNNLPIEKTAKEYIRILKKYQRYRKDGVISGMAKFRGTFSKVFLDRIFYLDFYSIERFGKTKLGQLLLYAKQSQNRQLMKELADDIRPSVEKIIRKFKIDGVGFIPPTVKREIQFMRELERNLHPDAREISIVKVKTEIMVPQKTLSKLRDRIENARRTIVVNEEGHYKNILLIDDAVGSGATLNETAAQIKDKDIAKKVFGLSIAGSFKGFDVISEV